MANIIQGKSQNSITYVGKLHSFTLREGTSKNGGKYISGRLNIATDENSVFNTEVFAMALRKDGTPNPTYVLLLDILKGAPTVIDRTEDDNKLSDLFQDKDLARSIMSGLALAPRKTGFEEALNLRIVASFDLNVYEDKDGNEVVNTKRSGFMVSVSKDAPKADFKVHARIMDVVETSQKDVFTVKAFAMNYNQNQLIPITLKVDIPGAGDALGGIVGDIVLLEGQEKSLVIEKETQAGVFGTRMIREYNKGFYIQSADMALEFDEDAFNEAKQNYEVAKAQVIADAKARKLAREGAPQAAAAAPTSGGFKF